MPEAAASRTGSSQAADGLVVHGIGANGLVASGRQRHGHRLRVTPTRAEPGDITAGGPTDKPLVHGIGRQQHPADSDPVRATSQPSIRISVPGWRKRPVGDHLLGWSPLVHGVRFGNRDRADHHQRDHRPSLARRGADASASRPDQTRPSGLRSQRGTRSDGSRQAGCSRTSSRLTPGSEPCDIVAGARFGAVVYREVGNKIGRIAIAPPFVATTPPPALTPPAAAAKKKICKVPKLKGSTAKQARKKLKRAGCQFRLRGRGRVTRSKPKAGARTTKRVQVTLKQKRRKAKKAVTRRLLTVKGGLQQ